MRFNYHCVVTIAYINMDILLWLVILSSLKVLFIFLCTRPPHMLREYNNIVTRRKTFCFDKIVFIIFYYLYLGI